MFQGCYAKGKKTVQGRHTADFLKRVLGELDEHYAGIKLTKTAEESPEQLEPGVLEWLLSMLEGGGGEETPEELDPQYRPTRAGLRGADANRFQTNAFRTYLATPGGQQSLQKTFATMQQENPAATLEDAAQALAGTYLSSYRAADTDETKAQTQGMYDGLEADALRETGGRVANSTEEVKSIGAGNVTFVPALAALSGAYGKARHAVGVKQPFTGPVHEFDPRAAAIQQQAQAIKARTPFVGPIHPADPAAEALRQRGPKTLADKARALLQPSAYNMSPEQQAAYSRISNDYRQSIKNLRGAYGGVGSPTELAQRGAAAATRGVQAVRAAPAAIAGVAKAAPAAALNMVKAAPGAALGALKAVPGAAWRAGGKIFMGGPAVMTGGQMAYETYAEHKDMQQRTKHIDDLLQAQKITPAEAAKYKAEISMSPYQTQATEQAPTESGYGDALGTAATLAFAPLSATTAVAKSVFDAGKAGLRAHEYAVGPAALSNLEKMQSSPALQQAYENMSGEVARLQALAQSSGLSPEQLKQHPQYRRMQQLQRNLAGMASTKVVEGDNPGQAAMRSAEAYDIAATDGNNRTSNAFNKLLTNAFRDDMPGENSITRMGQSLGDLGMLGVEGFSNLANRAGTGIAATKHLVDDYFDQDEQAKVRAQNLEQAQLQGYHAVMAAKANGKLDAVNDEYKRRNQGWRNDMTDDARARFDAKAFQSLQNAKSDEERQRYLAQAYYGTSADKLTPQQQAGINQYAGTLGFTKSRQGLAMLPGAKAPAMPAAKEIVPGARQGEQAKAPTPAPAPAPTSATPQNPYNETQAVLDMRKQLQNTPGTKEFFRASI